MLKQIAGTIAAMAMVLAVAGSASATWWPPKPTSNDVKVINEHMFVMTSTDSYAGSGYNDQWAVGKYGGDVFQKLTTGNASGTAFSGVMAGYTAFPGCDCFEGDVFIKNDGFKVMTFTDATGKTGGNDQWAVAKSWKSDVFQNTGTGNATAKGESQVLVGYTQWQVFDPAL